MYLLMTTRYGQYNCLETNDEADDNGDNSYVKGPWQHLQFLIPQNNRAQETINSLTTIVYCGGSEHVTYILKSCALLMQTSVYRHIWSVTQTQT